MQRVNVNVSEEEINLMKENAIPRNTKHAKKFGMTLLKVRCENLRNHLISRENSAKGRSRQLFLHILTAHANQMPRHASSMRAK